MQNKKVIIIAATLVIVFGLFGLNLWVNNAAEESLENSISKFEADTGFDFEYGDFQVNILGNAVISDITIDVNSGYVDIEEIKFKGLKSSPEEIKDFSMEVLGIGFSNLEGLRIDDTPNTPQEILAYELAREGRELDIKADFDINRDDNELDINHLSLSIRNIGYVELETKIVSEILFSEQPNLAAKIDLHDFSLEIRERGAVNVMLSHAIRGDQTVESLKEEVLANGQQAYDRAQGFEKELTGAALSLIRGDRVRIFRESDEALDINPMMLTSPAGLIRLSEEANFKVNY